jgi:hypothetical protein
MELNVKTMKNLRNGVHEHDNVHTKSRFLVHVLKTCTQNRTFLYMTFQNLRCRIGETASHQFKLEHQVCQKVQRGVAQLHKSTNRAFSTHELQNVGKNSSFLPMRTKVRELFKLERNVSRKIVFCNTLGKSC